MVLFYVGAHRCRGLRTYCIHVFHSDVIMWWFQNINAYYLPHYFTYWRAKWNMHAVRVHSEYHMQQPLQNYALCLLYIEDDPS